MFSLLFYLLYLHRCCTHHLVIFHPQSLIPHLQLKVKIYSSPANGACMQSAFVQRRKSLSIRSLLTSVPAQYLPATAINGKPNSLSQYLITNTVYYVLQHSSYVCTSQPCIHYSFTQCLLCLSRSTIDHSTPIQKLHRMRYCQHQ